MSEHILIAVDGSEHDKKTPQSGHWSWPESRQGRSGSSMSETVTSSDELVSSPARVTTKHPSW